MKTVIGISRVCLVIEMRVGWIVGRDGVMGILLEILRAQCREAVKVDGKED